MPRVSADVSLARGRFTLAADSMIADCVTMKMIRSTRKMSVSGVMLISATMSPPFSSACSLPRAMDTSELGSLHHATDTGAQHAVEIAHLDLQAVEEDDRQD